MDEIAIDGPRHDMGRECEPILRSLPDWFGIEDSIVDYVGDIGRMPTFVAIDRDAIVGFITLNRHFEHAAEMHVLGLLPAYHRQGLGRRLVDACERWLASEGVEYVQVKTIAPSKDCKPYAQTRAFYLSMGYRMLEEFPKLWDPSNPCVILLKYLGLPR